MLDLLDSMHLTVNALHTNYGIKPFSSKLPWSQHSLHIIQCFRSDGK